MLSVYVVEARPWRSAGRSTPKLVARTSRVDKADWLELCPLVPLWRLPGERAQAKRKEKVLMLSFETPFHDMCASHTALLYKSDRTIESVYFDYVQLSKCPDIIATEEGRFKYRGVSDGQAIYRQEIAEVES